MAACVAQPLALAASAHGQPGTGQNTRAVARGGPLPIRGPRMAGLADAPPTAWPATPSTGRLCPPGAALTLEEPRSAPSHPCSTIPAEERRSRLHDVHGVALQVEGMRQQAALTTPQGCRRIETEDVRFTADLSRAGQGHVHRKPSPQKAAEQAASHSNSCSYSHSLSERRARSIRQASSEESPWRGKLYTARKKATIVTIIIRIISNI